MIMLFCGFINSITEQSKYCSEMMKKHFNKEIVMAKNIMKILRNLFKKPIKVGSAIILMFMVILK